MYALLNPFIDLCLLRRRPQDLPASPLLLGIVLLVHSVVGVFASAQLMALPQALAAGLAGSLMLALLPVLVLQLMRRRERILQTLTALAGSLALLDLAALPVTDWWQSSRADGQANPLAIALMFAMFAWNLAVTGHVLRHAMEIGWAGAVLLALGFYVLFIDVMSSLFPIAG